MTQFNISVIGSLRNGYTATAEKVIASSVSYLSNAPVEVKSATIEVEAPVLSPVQLKLEMESQKLRRGAVRSTVKIAADKAETAAKETLTLLGAVGRGMEINSTVLNTSESVMATAKVAVTAADAAINAIKNAEEAVKAGIVNSETEKMADHALKISKEAEVAVKNAVKEVKTIKEGNTSTPSLRNVVIAAKNVADEARKNWAELYDRMNRMSGGRKHTQRKHKHQKRYTARK
jgi:hypothetical protein